MGLQPCFMPRRLDPRRSRALAEKSCIYDEGWRSFANWSASSRSTQRCSMLKRPAERIGNRLSGLSSPAKLFGRPACDQKTVKPVTRLKLVLHPARLLAATGPSLSRIFWILILIPILHQSELLM
jgi:hypothetical protein